MHFPLHVFFKESLYLDLDPRVSRGIAGTRVPHSSSKGDYVGHKIRLELAIQTPGCPINSDSNSMS